MELNLEPIKRVKTISKEEFLKEYFALQKPVVIERLTQDWPAYHKWNLNYINEVAGEKKVPLYDDRPLSSEFKFNEPHTYMKMSEYINLLKTKPTNYRIFLYNLLKEVPKLQKDFKYPDIGFKFLKKMPMLFFGGINSKVFMHYDIDLANIIHFHFNGEKQCILFPPSQTKYLYKVPHALISHQGIDFQNPDVKKWPALKNAQGYITNLKHGETLYMPEGYWHQMTYLTPGFSMSIRSYPKKTINFIKAVYNVFIMRHFDNVMRKTRGEKWMNYKNEKAILRTNKRNGYLINDDQ
ncbi:cupin-like domain-containing protein [Aquimarina sp. AD10]|uniref:cupin-like domain-containing protein n=1 Tax=Aquimarina sp. AD10 TaxID=1714849 RepID=UPI000E52A1EC|nr:cupin-like domain-containing protein [Aquimarina sp. AD10]AXT62150.1 cupin-like domain-containing protein [Aquimarina sp. AD10]RKM90655.1 cupin-like domain-containing protein [Aquimarina sp. AD10]